MTRISFSSAVFSGYVFRRWGGAVYLSTPIKYLVSAFVVSLCYPVVYAQPAGVAVHHSDASALSLAVTISSDLSELRKQHFDSSSFCFVKTIPVMVPNGGSAVLLSADGSYPAPVTGLGVLNLQRNIQKPLVELSKPYLVRGKTLVTCRVHPVTGNNVFTQVSIRIGLTGGQFASSTSATPDPMFDRIFGKSVANYGEASKWPVAARIAGAPMAPTENPFAETSSWAKLTIGTTGLCRVTGSSLQSAGVSIVGMASNSIRMFNSGASPIPFNNSVPRPELQEISILVLDGGDGQFDNADQIVWFGEAINRWQYWPDSIPKFVTNIYTDENVYWLTTSGSFSYPAMRMESLDGTIIGADTTIASFRNRVHVEQDNLLSQDDAGHITDYYAWYWTDATNLSFTIPTPGAVVGDTADIALRGWTGVSSSSQRYMSVRVNGVMSPSDIYSCGSTSCGYKTTALADGNNAIEIGLTPVSSAIPPYFNWFEVIYNCSNRTSGDKLDLYLGQQQQRRALIQIEESASASPILLNLSDRLHPKQVTGTTRLAGQLTFEAEVGPTSVNRFYYGTLATSSAPTSIRFSTVENLRNTSSQTDLLIIAPKQFESAMSTYVSIVQQRGYAVKVVSLESIIDNFGYGMYDPTAIRDYLKFAYETFPSPAPSAVLFVGDANYDLRDRLGTHVENLVPSFVNPIEGAFLAGSYSDDNYVFFGSYGLLDGDRSYPTGDRGYDMITARWPVRSSSEIRTIVDKIRTYESSPDFGSWRTNVTLVADDEFGAFNSESFHVTQIEELEKRHLPRVFNRNKIYLWDYPFVNNVKPAVNEAILDAFNSGTLLVNYVGHGNPDVWAHERVFTRTGDLPNLRDNGRLPLVYAASCAIGYFDDPQRQAMGEDLLILPNGGAIGVISAMRIVFSSDNAAFNRAVFDVLMYNDSLSIGEAFYTAKLLRQYGNDTIAQREDNDRAYVYFGDPLLRLGSPRLRLSFTETPDSLVALNKHHVTGVITEDDGTIIPRDGTLKIAVFDSDRQRSHNILGAGNEVIQRVDYKIAGPSIFNGSASVVAGKFSFDFIAPLDIGFGGAGARITAYAALDTVDAVFLRDSLKVSSGIAVSDDSVGPSIRYTVGERTNFVSGDAAGSGESLHLRIGDSSGINLTGSMGHGITVEVDGKPEETLNLTTLFAFDTDSYMSGSLDYSLTSLSEGAHTFQVRAWDNANNVSSVTFTIDLQSGSQLALNDLLNYPNPMQDQTTFYFELTRSVTSLSIEVFTLSGRRIWSVNGQGLQADNYPNGDFTAIWNGRDSDGSRVASGVYIYRALAVPDNGGEPVESFGKVVVVN